MAIRFFLMNMKTGYRTCLQVMVMGIIVHAALHLSPARAGSPMYDEGLAAYSSGDIATAYQLWEPLAEHGDPDAQFALASLYYDGIGVPVDHTESSYWFLLAAKQGHAYAQYNIGNAYKRGEGVRQSDAMAVHWWEKAAEQSLAEAQYTLALAYQEGAGVPRDEQMAARYYRQAAENGHPDASAAIAETDRPERSSIAETNRPARSSNETDCEHWLSEQSPNAYTLQLMSTTRSEDIQELAREHDLSDYVVCSYIHEGNTRYALLIGAYPNIDTASAAAAGLPRGLKTGKPWVRKIKDLMRIAAGTAH
jgi:TPR repeat protein